MVSRRSKQAAERAAAAGAAAGSRRHVPPLVWSIALHGALLLMLIVPLKSARPPQPAPLPEIVNATAVDQSSLDAALAAQRAREEAAERARQAERERARQAAEAERLRIAAAERAREEAKRREAEEQARLAREAQEEAARKEAERKAQEEAARKEAERKAQERAEAERRERERREAELAAALAAEEAERAARAEAARDQEEIARYIAAITTRVQQNFVYPDLKTGLRCTLYVKMLPGGEVIDARVLESSGDSAFDRQAILAVKQASPLPVPSERRLFDKMREIRFIFDPR